ncbi:hypothetical protein [Helicobacter cappadocius]|uniref:Lipoprotein n=1 Tax=Helicobacter cappadocius TaxID=3063998 RepID=A0AA90Q1E5_9HELI|nr:MULTISPECIES: hypothetical protein [unclassified Helicobacter]MDO7252526.1 hypothetical protein [Helicobacter sp. faydin-H75]MDP2538393.1 hypothetical protein [Helicobacter sp. faydin-H76]
MLNSRILLSLLAIIFLLACSDKQSSDEGEKELKDSVKLDFLNAKYMMSLSQASWEGIQLNRLENGRYSLVFSFITPYESKDCVLQGEGKQKEDEFYFFSKSNDLKVLLKRTDDGLAVGVDNKKIQNVCGKDHRAKGIYTISQ